MLKNKKRIFCKVEDFDENPYMLNCRGMAINLKTGEQRVSLPADMFTKSAPVIPEEGECPLFYKFLFEITSERLELAQWRETCCKPSPDEVRFS
ncbi:MAG: hypothetical protein LBC51_07930 [Treponema sp.]|jgi:phage/plasmid-associated DNA primase|nr:hypothetical protein [Treponema sp.]